MISILGIPLDENSSFLKGTAKAPRLIMDAFHSDASNSSSHGTENLADNSGGSQADQSSHCVKSDSGSSPMEGIEEGTYNGNDTGNSVGSEKNEIETGSELNNATKMSTNCQVDMNMSDTEYSEKE